MANTFLDKFLKSLNPTQEQELPSDGDLVRNILMKGVLPPTTTPNFTGKDSTWWTPEGPIKQEQMPPSPLLLEDQQQMIKDMAQANLIGQPIPTPIRQPAAIEEPQKPIKTKTTKPKVEPKEEQKEAPVQEPREPTMLEKLLADINAPEVEDTELKDALRQQQEMIRNVGIAQGAQQIGAALGGIRPDQNYLQFLNEAAKSKVSGIKELRESQAQKQKVKQEKVKFAMDTEKGMLDLDKARAQTNDLQAMQDPNSELSKAWRETARTRFKLAGVQVPKNLISDTLPASKVKELFPSGDIVDDLLRLRGIEESATSRKEARTERNQQVAQQQVDRYVQHTQDKFKDDVTSVKEGRIAVAALESALRNPTSVKDTQALYNMIKSFDPNTAVREGEIVLASKGQSYMDNMKNIFSRLSSNPRLLSTRYLKDVYEYAQQAQKAREGNYRQTMDTRLDYAKKRLGLPEGQEIFIDPLYEEMKKKERIPSASPFNVDAAKAELEKRKKGP